MWLKWCEWRWQVSWKYLNPSDASGVVRDFIYIHIHTDKRGWSKVPHFVKHMIASLFLFQKIFAQFIYWSIVICTICTWHLNILFTFTFSHLSLDVLLNWNPLLVSCYPLSVQGDQRRKKHIKRGPGLLWGASGQKETCGKLHGQPDPHGPQEVFPAQRRGSGPPGVPGQSNEWVWFHSEVSAFSTLSNLHDILQTQFKTTGSDGSIHILRNDLTLTGWRHLCVFSGCWSKKKNTMNLNMNFMLQLRSVKSHAVSGWAVRLI